MGDRQRVCIVITVFLPRSEFSPLPAWAVIGRSWIGARHTWPIYYAPQRDAATIMSDSTRAALSSTVKVQLDEAARLFALKKYEETADLLASALEELYVAY